MDPKTPPNLDPKLRETYERIMGTSFPPATDTPKAETAQSVAPSSGHQTTPQASPEHTPAMATPSTPGPSVSPFTAPAVTPIPSSMNGSTAPTPAAPAPVKLDVSLPSEEPAKPEKKKSSIMPVLLIVGGIIFFLVYALFWAKIFNLPLPFLSS